MSDNCDAIAPQCKAACAPPVQGRLWVARAIVVLLIALAVAVVETSLIEHAVSTGANCDAGAACRVIRIVDNSLASGLAPIANVR